MSSFDVQSATPVQRECLQGDGATLACNLPVLYRPCCAQSSSSYECTSARQDVLQSWSRESNEQGCRLTRRQAGNKCIKSAAAFAQSCCTIYPTFSKGKRPPAAGLSTKCSASS